jgi:hypothetical protein
MLCVEPRDAFGPRFVDLHLMIAPNNFMHSLLRCEYSSALELGQRKSRLSINRDAFDDPRWPIEGLHIGQRQERRHEVADAAEGVVVLEAAQLDVQEAGAGEDGVGHPTPAPR